MTETVELTLLDEIKRLRPHYQTNGMLDAGRRQLLDHFEQFALTRSDPAVRDRVTDEAALAQAYLRGVEWRDENPGDVDYAYRFKAACDYADARTSPPEPASGLPERCPDCGLHWGHHPPAVIVGSEQVRCVECKTVWSSTPPAKEPQ